MYQQMTNDAEHYEAIRIAAEDYTKTSEPFWSYENRIVDECDKDKIIEQLSWEYYLEHSEMPDSWMLKDFEDDFYPIEWVRDEDTGEGYWRDL